MQVNQLWVHVQVINLYTSYAQVCTRMCVGHVGNRAMNGETMFLSRFHLLITLASTHSTALKRSFNIMYGMENGKLELVRG